MKIGITERGDAGLDFGWESKLDKVDGVILITKSPQNLLDKNIPDNAIIHCSITGYGGTKLEPGVKSPEICLEAYNKLVEKYGSERVVLRVDPIFPTERGLQTALKIVSQCKGRLRISFADMYPHVVERFEKKNLNYEFTNALHAPIGVRYKAYEIIKKICPQVEVCGEPNFPCTGCISEKDLSVMNLSKDDNSVSGQRKACMCLGVKTELLSQRGQCDHGCLYCYWK